MSSRAAADGGRARRAFLRGLALGLPAFAALPARPSGAPADRRWLQLVNTHTGEAIETAYFEDGAYRPSSMGQLDWVLRDHRTGAVHPVREGVFDLLYALAASAGAEPRYEVISGYRSPETNAMLAARSDGVSTKSLHMEGLAVDVRLRGVATARLRDLAVAAQAGGVGYYPRPDFVHLDLGRVRQWAG